jgi:DUF4097 and DUF4098 domain-containing protein YvlB
MKKIISIVLLSVCVSFITKAQERIKIPLSDPAKPATIQLSVVTGSVKAEGYDGNEVVILFENEGSKSENSGNLVKISNKWSGDLIVEENQNNIIIRTPVPNKKMNIKLQVPINSNLKLSAVNGGALVVENVSGSIEAKNVNGSILMKNISGTVSANTVNGSIDVQFSKVNANPMAFTTINGSINVTLPGSSALNVRIKTNRGNIFSVFDIRPERDSQNSGEAGMRKINTNNNVSGIINGGGPEFFLTSVNGNIKLRKN